MRFRSKRIIQVLSWASLTAAILIGGVSGFFVFYQTISAHDVNCSRVRIAGMLILSFGKDRISCCRYNNIHRRLFLHELVAGIVLLSYIHHLSHFFTQLVI